MDALTPLSSGRMTPPYFADWDGLNIAVFPARSKTGMVIANPRGSVTHVARGMGVVYEGSQARFGARFLCARGSNDVSVVANADNYGGLCAVCEDAAKGPCVYRCFGNGGELLYIGSTVAREKRMSFHAARTRWWPEVAEVRAEYCATIAEARAAELQAILSENPLRNLRPKGRARQVDLMPDAA